MVRSRNDDDDDDDDDVANNKKDAMLDTTTITTTAAAADGELQKGNSTAIADWEKDEPAVAAAGSPNVNMITSSKFTYEELKKMHYLDAAMTESMRLYPPVSFDSKLAIMEEDTWPDGTHIPKDSVVAYAPYAMGRMRSSCGEAIAWSSSQRDGLMTMECSSHRVRISTLSFKLVSECV
jgi:hypothetical protein